LVTVPGRTLSRRWASSAAPGRYHAAQRSPAGVRRVW